MHARLRFDVTAGRRLAPSPSRMSRPRERGFRIRTLLSKRVSPLLANDALLARPLRSTDITPLPRYYGPVRLPAWAQPQVMFSPMPIRRATHTAHPGLPGSSVDLCARAVPNHPGKPDDCSRSFLRRRLQASSNLADWPLPLCVTRPNRVRFRYGSRARSPELRRPDHSKPRPVRFLLYEQLTGQPPLRLLDRPGFAWRTR
jgi:hypothetical protein